MTTHITLPGIVNDQPEIFESIPSPIEDDSHIELDSNEPAGTLLDGAFDLNEIPIKDAFSFFAEREQQIAQFFIQRHGEYKIKADKTDEETDIEKYFRLVSEVTELLDKFKWRRNKKLDEVDEANVNSLSSTKIVQNLDQLSSQLKILEFAANDGSLNQSQAGLDNIKSKLDDLPSKIRSIQEPANIDLKTNATINDPSLNIKLSALERKITLLEKLVGQNSDSERLLFERTKCESLLGSAETLCSWLSLFRVGNFEKVDNELDYLSRKLDTIIEKQANDNEVQIDQQTRTALDSLCKMVTATDSYRAMVPTIIHRLNIMEELQQRAAQVVTAVDHLEDVQSKIEDSIKSNESELSSLKDMFAKNIELMKEFSADIDAKISSIKE